MLNTSTPFLVKLKLNDRLDWFIMKIRLVSILSNTSYDVIWKIYVFLLP